MYYEVFTKLIKKSDKIKWCIDSYPYPNGLGDGYLTQHIKSNAGMKIIHAGNKYNSKDALNLY